MHKYSLRHKELADLEKLIVKPTYSTGWTVRSPLPEERADLKNDVVDFYGLAVLPTPGHAPTHCFTHMGGPPVPWAKATLAHIWPSSEADAADLLAGELKLDKGFHIHPRNFIILPDDVHKAFDHGWLLFIPRQGQVILRAAHVSTVRVGRDPMSDESIAKKQWVSSMDGQKLVFNNDERPFMRVLGWRTWTMLGSGAQDELVSQVDEAVEDAGSVDAEGNAALKTRVDKSRRLLSEPT